MALVDKNLDRRSSKMREPTRAAAEAFVQYLFSPEAQAEFAESGFRFMPSWSLSRMCTGASHGSRAAVVYMQLLQQSGVC